MIGILFAKLVCSALNSKQIKQKKVKFNQIRVQWGQTLIENA
jgi:hypothetical protein